MTTRRLHNFVSVMILALPVFGAVQRASAQTSPSIPAPASQQAISQTGLLPLFAVDMSISPTWVDGDAFPSASPQFSHSGANDVMDASWTSLKSAGFNAIRFPVHLEDPKAAVRLANLCVWASGNGVRLIPVLEGTDALRKNSSNMSAALSSFVTNLITQLRGNAGAALTSYTQISFFQLEGPINHMGLYAGVKPATAQKLLIASSEALRKAEAQALQGTGMQGTPISIAASYDFELIRGGAIAGVPLDPAAEQKAQNSLKDFLTGFKSPTIDAINVEWFPRSISAGDVDHFVTLLQFIKQAFPDKEITLTTGFSSAFNPADQTLQFYAAVISNLGNFRASDGVESKFAGVVFQQAFKGPNADGPMPTGTTDPSQWKWADRAQQLLAMWASGTPSADMTWWMGKVQDNMGFTALSSDATTATSVSPMPALQVLQEIASTMGQASQQVQTVGTVPASTGSPSATAATGFTTTTASGYVPGAQPSTQGASSQFQQMLFALLQQFTQQMTTKLMARFDGSNTQNNYVNQANAGVVTTPSGTVATTATVPGVSTTITSPVANTVWIGPTDVNVSTSSTAAGQPVVVTAQLHNQSADQDVSGLTIEVVNPTSGSNPAMQSGVTVPRGGVTPVQLTWTPDATVSGDVHLLLQTLDSSGQVVTTVAVPQITVGAGNTVANTGSTTNTVSPTNSNSFTNTGSPTNPGSTTSTGSTPAAQPPAGQLKVAGFSFAEANASTAGQIPRLQAQISNGSQIPTQSGQAQLFVDGKPQQMQTVGSVLPSGTVILQFPPTQASTGQHGLQLVVTTADGLSTSATLVANVTTPGTGPVSRIRPPAPSVIRPMFRTESNVAATTLGTSSTTASVPSVTVGGSGTQNSAVVSTTSGTVIPRAVPQRGFARTITPTATTPRGPSQNNASAPVATSPGASTQLQTPPGMSMGVAGVTVSTPQRGTVRTITPGSAKLASDATVPQTTATLQTPAVRTITPGGSPGLQTPPAAATTSPAAKVAPSVVRTITPGMAATPRGAAPGASAISAVGSGTVPRTIAASPANPSGIASSSGFGSPKGRSTVPATATGIVDLTVSSQDIHVVPASPQAGQIATFTAVLRNNGTLPVQGATAVFSLMANGQRVAGSVPMVFNVSPHGTFQARWSTGMPAAGSVQVMISVVANGDVNMGNNQATVSYLVVASPPRMQLKPR